MIQSPKDKLSRTSMSLALMAIFSSFVFPVALPYIFGSVAIVLAVLSKGRQYTFPRRSRSAVIVASIAIAVNTAMIISSILYIMRVMKDPQLQEQFSQNLYQMYGITFEDLMRQLGIQSSAAGSL